MGDHDDVDPRSLGRRQPTEALAQEAPRPVAGDRAADLPAHGEAEPVEAAAALGHHKQEQPAGEARAPLEHGVELGGCAQPPAGPVARPHAPPRIPAPPVSGRDALAALLAAALQDQLAPLGAHAHEEAVGALAATVVRLERPLHW